MLSDQRKTNEVTDFTNLPPELAKEKLLDVLFLSIESCLTSFKSDLRNLFPEFDTVSDTIIERFYDGEFSHFFQIAVSKAGFAGYFTFHDENTRSIDLLLRNKKKGLSRQVDIGIRLQSSRDRILVIEGKRLYDKYDKQYVLGNTGGIYRFKKELHGMDLNRACLIGFVENEDYSDWLRFVNKWIIEGKTKHPELKWGKDSEELLSPTNTTLIDFTSYRSTNSRISLPPIVLDHYWVKVF